MHRFLLHSLFFIMITLHSCGEDKTNNKNKIVVKDTLPTSELRVSDASIAGNFSAQTALKIDSPRLDVFLKKYPLFTPYKSDLKKFYADRKYAFAWYDQKGLIEQSGDLYNRVMNINDEGLPEKILYMDDFKLMMETADSSGQSVEQESEHELMLTAQYFNYARNVWAGVPENVTTQLEWFVPRKKIDYNHFLDSLLNAMRNGKPITEPVHPQYNLLKVYLKKFREFEKNNSWVQVKTDKKKLQKGDSGEAIVQIRRKLFMSKDLTGDTTSPVFDDELEAAVKKYQYRYGLTEDGVVGPSILREMNTPIQRRIEQLIVNMERARWVTPNPASNYLLVNIPQFKLSVFENDSLAWDCNVVVGKEVHKTVVFRGDLKYVVFSPYWNVPPSIMKNEILPALKRNPNYLKTHNMEWNGNQIRQKPGGSNSLGLVKFLFPNSYNIYLHDSPSKPLFKEEKRAFSHGCIRVSEPRKLALYLLRHDPSWSEQKVDAAMSAGKEQYVTLKETIPVNIVYFTAWVDAKGRLNFRDDVYKRDARLMETIFQKSNKGAQ
jgi:murein L,D-transpeptidase YcbB/YkuD